VGRSGGVGLICRGVPPWAPALLPTTWRRSGAHGGTPLQIWPGGLVLCDLVLCDLVLLLDPIGVLSSSQFSYLSPFRLPIVQNSMLGSVLTTAVS
jgi:hypothetical protein